MAWTVCTKNASLTCYGCSPNQLAFSRNPNISSNLTKVISLYGRQTYNRLISIHLNALPTAEKSFVKVEPNGNSGLH